LEFLQTKRRACRSVDYNVIRAAVNTLRAELQIPDTFKTSNCFINSWMQRNNISCRRVTRTGAPEMRTVQEFKALCQTFFEAVQTATTNVNKSELFNMDQTPCYVDTVCSTSLHFRGGFDDVSTMSTRQHQFLLTGDKEVEVNSTGHTKDRFTACLVASSDGRKLAAHVVFKGKRQPKRLSNRYF
jgi:hypothetical protein